jgi:hypothetical protein
LRTFQVNLSASSTSRTLDVFAGVSSDDCPLWFPALVPTCRLYLADTVTIEPADVKSGHIGSMLAALATRFDSLMRTVTLRQEYTTQQEYKLAV